MVIVVIAAVGFWVYSQYTQPPGVVRFSIDRSVIKQRENATITVVLENFDLRTHKVEYRFNASDKVWIYEGAEKPLPRNDSQYIFNYTLEAADPSVTKVFVVIGTLGEDISSATYPISLSVYFDGDQLPKTWSDLTLKVEE